MTTIQAATRTKVPKSVLCCFRSLGWEPGFPAPVLLPMSSPIIAGTDRAQAVRSCVNDLRRPEAIYARTKRVPSS
jgi:hypothetical protein